MIHWLDGLKTLNSGFWKMWLKNPVENSLLALLVLAVALRDFFLWVCMGEHYLDGED
jgi:hypothetical protein